MNLLERLEKIKTRFDQINSQLSDAANTNDYEKIKVLNKERINLEEIIAAYEKYSTVIKNIDGNFEIINSNQESELVEMAEIELDELKNQKEIMEEEIKRIDTNDLRVNLTEYLKKNMGDTIYITRYNRLVGEIRVYTEEIRRKTELRIAKKMIEAADREKK